MDKITVGVFDEHRIVKEGICSILKTGENFDVVFTSSDPIELVDMMKTSTVNVLIVNIHHLTPQSINLVSKLTCSYPRTRILILSSLNTEEIILKTIKAGAKGFLSSD